MITRSTFNEEYVPGYFALAVDEFTSALKMYDKIAKVMSSTKKKEDKLYRSSLGYLAEKGEGEPIGYDTPIGNLTKSWVHKTYALGVRATEEAIDDNLYEFGQGGNAGQDIKELFTDLGRSAAETPELELAKIFNYATATTFHTGNDGLALASASHTRLDGSAYSNLGTSSDLTYTTFWSAVVAAENQYDHRQKRIRCKVRALLVPPQMERQAREILFSTDRPDTANRATNALVQSGRKFELYVWSYLTDVDSWFLLLDEPFSDLIFFWRRRTRFAKEADFETGDLRAKVDQRFSCEAGDPRFAYFNIP
jgi:phage major head subunit gpT-like protein